MSDAGSRVHVLGAPFNSAGRTDGVARAPSALRNAGLVGALGAVGVDVLDRGDATPGPTSPARDPTSGLIAPAALAAMIRSVRGEVEATLDGGGFPLVLGGDCPVLLGCLGARGSGSPPGLLFLDGHEDAWPPLESTSGEAADMELGFVLGLTLATLPDEVADEIPRLEPRRVVVVGARDADELAAAGVRSIADVVHLTRPEELVASDPDSVAAEAASSLSREGAWWLHVDLDVLSTQSLSSVDYPQRGGLEWDALTRLTRRALAGPGVIGWDVTIYNPDLDPSGTDAKRIVRYLAEAAAGLLTAVSSRQQGETAG